MIQRTGFLTLGLGLALTIPVVARAFGSCTPGVDCYCDTVNDPLLARCLDWEDPEFTTNNGQYPWHKAPGPQPGFRGGDGIWQRTFGPASGDCAWLQGQPSQPTLGTPCTYSDCAAAAEWRPDDRYNGNSKTCVDFQRNGDVDAEVAGLTLTGGHGGEVFDGQAHLAQRIRVDSTSALASAITPTLTRDMGITMARAYSTNLLSANPRNDGNWLTQPWKGEQTSGGLQFPEGNTGGTANNPPFSGGTVGMTSLQNCQSAVAAAEVRIGNVQCEAGSNVFRIAAARINDCSGRPTCNDTNEFNRSRDWPLGTWGCVRAYWGGMATSNGELYIEFQGPNDASPRRIFWVRNLNLAQIFGSGAQIGQYVFDSYYNGNGGTSYDVPATQTFYRYMDNVHVRRGEPVTCEQIGFTSSANPLTPPAAPILFE